MQFFCPIGLDFESSPGRARRRVNHYLLTSKIGVGASSSVYLGVDERTDRLYAIKRIRLRDLAHTGSGIAQLEREIRLIRQFDHPNILRLIEVLHVPADGEVFLVLEYADRGCLEAFIERGQVLELAAVFSIVKQVALGLRYVHAIGYVHQDIKPSNILLDAAGRAIIADFGIGHTFQSAELFIGSPAFQSPEALDDTAEDPRSQDVWALGVTLYVALFGRLPYFGCDIFEVVSEIKEHELAIPEGTDARIAALLRGMLAVDPAERIGIEEILANELIAGAPERAPNVPDVPLPREKDGDIVQVTATVCDKECSFANQVSGHQRRSSFDNGIMASGTFGNFS